MTTPTVSIVVVNYNGLRHLEPCFSSLVKQTHPADKLELILIDNNSSDGSLEWMAAHMPQVRVIANDQNVGFAPAVNQGARAASGEYVALINNDAYADPHWIAAMVRELEAHRAADVVCVGAKMLDWHGKRIDFVSGGINFYGHGDQFFHRLPVDAVAPESHELLFACGGAMLVDRKVFLQTGGFDEDYFAYFEDVDFGWRLWVQGYKVRFAPDAIVYHRQHATANTMYGHQVRMVLERNALATIIKNYDDQHLQQVLPAALLMIIKRSLVDGGSAFDRREFDMRQRSTASTATTMEVPKVMLSYLAGLSDIIEDFPALWRKRQQIQAARRRPDAEILPLFGRPMGVTDLNVSLHMFQEVLTEAFDLRSLFAGTKTTRVLIISTDPLHAKLAGPGIRAVEMARHLAAHCHVVLAAPDRADIEMPEIECIRFDRDDHETMMFLALQAEVIVVQGFTLDKYPVLTQLGRVIVVDLYDPFHLENLELYERQATRLEQADILTFTNVQVINQQLRFGDFFICASERQRDFWLGALGTLGRLSPTNYATDHTFRSLIDVVPFGLSATPPQHTQPVLKGVVPGIAADDTVVLWGGGIWEWLDPLTVIRAMAVVREQRSDIKLFFLGQHHPNAADVPQMRMYDQAVALADELGLRDSTVFFNDRWVDYTQRQNYLLEADIGVSAHLEHVETRFAFRTRLLDYIWAGLPMVVSAGDTLADTVAQWGLGHVVPIGDEHGFAAAVLDLAGSADPRGARQAAFEQTQARYTWPVALQALTDFCRQPHYAPDRMTQIAAPADGQTSLRSRLDDMDRTIHDKNDHIAYLEGLIKQLEAGRVMQILSKVNRLRRF